MSPSVLWYTQSEKQVLDIVRSSTKGLTSEEVKKRQSKEGPNILPKETPDAWWKILFRQFLNPLIFVLLIAALVSGVLQDFIDTLVILAAVGVNTIIGFVQEWKASRALIHLQNFIQPLALVHRDGRDVEIPAQELVIGDLLLLQTGEQVAADARLIESVELQANEAPLTGESLPVTKNVEELPKGTMLAERSNMVFAGTVIVGGHGLAVVTAIGQQTEIGHIAELLSSIAEIKTPLQKQLGSLARWLGVLIVFLVVSLFILGVLVGRGVAEMFEMSVALAVAAIPEGLTVAVTIILAIGMQRILKHRALVRHLVAAETLGSVSVICSDKTGTITEGNMKVVSVVTPEDTFDLNTLRGLIHQGDLRHLLESLVLCNDARQTESKNGIVIHGSATERALFLFALEVGIDAENLRAEFPILADKPFDSERKYRLTEFVSDHAWKLVMMGAPSKVFPACQFTKKELQFVESQEKLLTNQGLRLIAVAQKNIRSKREALSEKDLFGFRFLGLVVLQDPLRPDVADQILSARNAGIRTVIVTGDHPQTAQTIAKEAGLHVNIESVISGSELDNWSDEELARRISRISIFARVEPRHKIRIVRAWQERGEVVAMTGDGVNDAPALKAADIGIALGSGTEVAKQASDLVLLDNSFSTITAAIEQGRVMFENIRKSTVYLMAGSFTELFLITGAILFGLPVPILPVQILWINLVADGLPNVGLVFEPGEKDVMQLHPRSRGEPVLNHEMMRIILTIGGVTCFVLFGLYLWLLATIPDIGQVRSIMFAAVGIDSLLYIFAVKSFRKTIFRINPFSNLWLMGGVAIGFALMALALIHPFFQSIFSITPLRLSDWVLLLIMGMMKLIVIELVKESFIYQQKKRLSIL